MGQTFVVSAFILPQCLHLDAPAYDDLFIHGSRNPLVTYVSAPRSPPATISVVVICGGMSRPKDTKFKQLMKTGQIAIPIAMQATNNRSWRVENLLVIVKTKTPRGSTLQCKQCNVSVHRGAANKLTIQTPRGPRLSVHFSKTRASPASRASPFYLTISAMSSTYIFGIQRRSSIPSEYRV